MSPGTQTPVSTSPSSGGFKEGNVKQNKQLWTERRCKAAMRYSFTRSIALDLVCLEVVNNSFSQSRAASMVRSRAQGSDAMSSLLQMTLQSGGLHRGASRSGNMQLSWPVLRRRARSGRCRNPLLELHFGRVYLPCLTSDVVHWICSDVCIAPAGGYRSTHNSQTSRRICDSRSSVVYVNP